MFFTKTGIHEDPRIKLKAVYDKNIPLWFIIIGFYGFKTLLSSNETRI